MTAKDSSIKKDGKENPYLDFHEGSSGYLFRDLHTYVGLVYDSLNRFEYPVNLGPVPRIMLKLATNHLEEVLAEPTDEKFVNNLTHWGTHSLLRIRRVMLDYGLEDQFPEFEDPIVESYARHMMHIGRVLNIPNIRSGAASILGDEDEVKRADELMDSGRHDVEKNHSFAISRVPLARPILRDYMSEFRKHPWNSTDLESYLADQKRQWKAARTSISDGE